MNKSELFTLTTGLLDNVVMDATLFDTFLNIAQMYWENQRPWAILRTKSSAFTVSPSNTFLNPLTLPDNLRKFVARSPIILVDSQNNVQTRLREVPIDAQFTYQNDPTKFYTDWAARRFYICGTFSQTLSAYLFYIRKSDLVSTDNESEWLFPEEYHPILALSVAVYYKLGVDYDLVNNAQADNNAKLALGIFQMMSEWDSDLQNSAQQGQDYGIQQTPPYTAAGGVIQPDA